MKILIGGGTGLIGTALTNSLLTDEHTVVIISRTPSSQNSPTRTIGWDHESLVAELATTNAVINLAGASIAGSNLLSMRWTKKRKDQIISSRILAGQNISRAILNSPKKPEMLIQASAIGYYGNIGPGTINESGKPGSDFLAQVCQSWEASTASVESLGVRRIITRIGLVFSQAGGLFPLLSLPFSLYAGGKIGSGQQYLSWIHINDVVNCLRFLLAGSQTKGIYNLTAPAPVTNQHFAELLGKTTHKPAWLPIPARLIKLLLGEAATLALDGRQIYPQRLLESGYIFNFPDPVSALRDLIKST